MSPRALVFATIAVAAGLAPFHWPLEEVMAAPRQNKAFEPWLDPKGDAKVDCTVLRLKIQERTKVGEKRQKAADKYFQARIDGKDLGSADVLVLYREYRDADQAEEMAKFQVDLATLNVAKHLNYSEKRLKQMWEYRVGAPAWSELLKGDSSQVVLNGIGLPFEESLHFCWFAVWS